MQTTLKAKRFTFAQIVKLSPVFASKLLFWKTFKHTLNLGNPQTFNEKLMWLKLFEDVEFKVRFTDKVKMREYMIALGYSHLLVPIIGIFEEVEDIIFEQLPRKFVMKCTHGSGFTIVCENKRELNYEKTRLQLAEMMATNYGLINAEPHYLKIKPKIIIEKYIEPSRSDISNAYKIHCFHGEPKIIELALKRNTRNEQSVMLTPDWADTGYIEKKLPYEISESKPKQLEDLLAIAKKLSKPFTYVRVDLNIVEEKIYFNKLNFTPDACLNIDIHEQANNELGQWLELNIGKRKEPVSIARSKS
ncbi:ATP-grasp fold amidoligase family protein [Solibacillus sp. FSL K6-4121]|uniref:ATP-grasp fold amidoligase family protein n=1 Tax=Solibacillus sp. FSL K6-4121 TaxID=2921505 RepID=UPI0030F6DAD7